MSYIRPLSNPEGLYVFGNLNGEVEILRNNETYTVPLRDFVRLCCRYINDIGYNGVAYKWKGISIKEVKVGKHFKMRLSYKDWHIDMWTVTLEYLARNASEHMK